MEPCEGGISFVPRLSAEYDEPGDEASEECLLTVGEKGGLGELSLLELIQSQCKQT